MRKFTSPNKKRLLKHLALNLPKSIVGFLEERYTISDLIRNCHFIPLNINFTFIQSTPRVTNYDPWAKSNQMPIFVVAMERSSTHSFKYCLWPTKPKYLLSGLVQRKSANPWSIPLAKFSYHSMFAKQPLRISDNLYNYYRNFFPPANQTASDPYLDFAIPALMSLGLQPSSCQQCPPQCPLDLYLIHRTTDCDTRFTVNS